MGENMENVEVSHPSILFNYDGKGNSVMYLEVDGEIKKTEFDRKWTEEFIFGLSLIRR